MQLGVPNDSRKYNLAAAILKHFKIQSVFVLTNNPLKIGALRNNNIQVLKRIPITAREFNL